MVHCYARRICLSLNVVKVIQTFGDIECFRKLFQTLHTHTWHVQTIMVLFAIIHIIRLVMYSIAFH
jgi:hypothetical protein